MRRAISKIGEKSEEVEGEDAIFVALPLRWGRARSPTRHSLSSREGLVQASRFGDGAVGVNVQIVSPLTSILSYRGERRYFAGLFSRQLSWGSCVCLLIADGNA